MAESAKPQSPKSGREQRLAEALRQNLRRRKAQAKERAADTTGEESGNDA